MFTNTLLSFVNARYFTYAARWDEEIVLGGTLTVGIQRQQLLFYVLLPAPAFEPKRQRQSGGAGLAFISEKKSKKILAF